MLFFKDLIFSQANPIKSSSDVVLHVKSNDSQHHSRLSNKHKKQAFNEHRIGEDKKSEENHFHYVVNSVVGKTIELDCSMNNFIKDEKVNFTFIIFIFHTI